MSKSNKISRIDGEVYVVPLVLVLKAKLCFPNVCTQNLEGRRKIDERSNASAVEKILENPQMSLLYFVTTTPVEPIYYWNHSYRSICYMCVYDSIVLKIIIVPFN